MKGKKVALKSVQQHNDEPKEQRGGSETKKSKLNGSGKRDLERPDPKSVGGMHQDTASTRDLFLRGLSFVYFIAFLSIYLQIDGLYGTNGVTPVKATLKLNSRTPVECLKETKSLICVLAPELGITSQHTMEFFALTGVIISGVGAMCVNCCVAPAMIILWILYFSIYRVGGVFLWFQWDILLLETGILGALAAPWFPTRSSHESKPKDITTMWMVKWLLFRLMFSSGVVKLMSGCPTWWGLTALNYHFETQCLPTPVAYFAHQLPHWILRLLVVGTYFIEIVVPFAFFAPSTFLRRFAFWTQVIFQLAIIITGNYNFFNLLTIVLCASLLDPEFLVPVKNQDNKFSFSKMISRSFSYVLILMGFYITAQKFGVKFNHDFTSIDSKVEFTRSEFDWFIAMIMPYALALGVLTFTSTLCQSVLVSLVDVKGCWSKFTSLLSSLFYGLLCAAVFGVTLVPFSSLHKESNSALWTPLKELHGNLSDFHVSSSYGLFRRMTGTEKGRPEVILEYANNLNGPWKEFNFLYKPGQVSAAPTFVFPHQPRLDWQLWFAALGTYHDNPWLVSLAYRLLQGESSVRELLDFSMNPSKPPKYVRASLYHYAFTKASTSPKDWWTRERSEEYMPTFSVDHAPLVEFISKLGYLEQDVPPKALWNTNLVKGLDTIRLNLQDFRPEHVIWSLLFAIIAIVLTGNMFSTGSHKRQTV